jgi:aryl-alcohol dehydrogenase-like predicted oxidoreductase
MKPDLVPATLARVEKFVALAREAGTTPARLALAWCLAQPGIDAVVVGAVKPDQVRENAQAAGVRLSAELLAKIDAIFPPVARA